MKMVGHGAAAILKWAGIFLLLPASLALLSACGGGGGGSGSSSDTVTIRVTGNLSISAGSASGVGTASESVSNARISVSGTKDYDNTDDQGNFYLVTDNSDSKITLLVDAPSFSGSYDIERITSSVYQVNVELQYDPELDVITAASQTFDVRSGN
jgi:hypothetical protein